MATDYRTERVDPLGPIPGYQHGHDTPARRHLPSHAYEQTARPPPHATAADVASVLGLPADAISPLMLEAVAPLLAEVERLHWLADQAEHRTNWLERQSDRHSVVPCLTRRAFVRDLDALLAGTVPVCTLALIQVLGVEAVRHLHGLAAGEAALRHIAANIVGALRGSDVVSCLGGSDFAVLLPATTSDQAVPKIEAICARIADPAFTWAGHRIALEPLFGLYEPVAGDSGESALAAADLARRGLAG